jgi:hypothetical protein
LDAGAGEARHARYFTRQRYCGVDLAVGDRTWNYSRLDAVADLTRLPFASGCFERRHPHRHAGTRPRAGIRSCAR